MNYPLYVLLDRVDVHVKGWTTKFLEENICEYIHIFITLSRK